MVFLGLGLRFPVTVTSAVAGRLTTVTVNLEEGS